MASPWLERMTAYEELSVHLTVQPKTWLITGVAGFIGSNLLETLLGLDQTVVGLDNFATGHQHNLDQVRELVTVAQWARFRLLRGDICNLTDCKSACIGVDYVLHQAALGSVPRSLENPIATNAANVSGFLNMLVAARDCKVARVVYAASSSTYGDNPDMPKVEDRIGRPLSPYAVTKYVNELYADIFARCYGLESIGLRYFNVFGPRQDPNGAYAAVIPKWIDTILKNEAVSINGDGETSRDFCYVANAVQANLLAATTPKADAINQVYNVATGERTSLNELFVILKDAFQIQANDRAVKAATYRPEQAGDIRHSQAHIGKAKHLLGYQPQFLARERLSAVRDWFTP